MNRIYRLVWNHTLNAFVVGSELAGARGKRGAASRLYASPTGALFAMGGMLMLAMAPPLHAADARMDELQALVAKYSTPEPALPPVAVTAAPMVHSGARAPVQITAHSAQLPPVLAQTTAVVKAPVAAVVSQAAGLPATVTRKAASSKPVAPVAAATTRVVPTLSGLVGKLPQVLGEVVDATGTGLQAVVGGLTPGKDKDKDDKNPLRTTLVSTVGAVEELTGALVKGTGVGPLLDTVVDGVAPVLEGVGDKTGVLVGHLTGSDVLAEGLSQTVGTVTQGLQGTTDALGKGDVTGTVQTLLGTVGDTVSTVTGTVTGTLASVTGSTSGLDGLQQVIDGVTGGVVGGVSNVVGQLGGQPAGTSGGGTTGAPAGAYPTGLVIGNGGLVGTVDQLVGPTVSTLFSGDGYLRNGGLTVSNANIAQAYSVTSVLGIPLVNLSPVGELLDGLGGLTTGGNSHMTLIGGVTSDNYITNINNGNPNGLLGLLLPDRAPDWAKTCLDPLGLGLATVECWGINAAQDYQVLIGDGAYANGSKEVVIGTNAEHRLAQQDANLVFPGAGGSDPTGVPSADYDARLGHSVVIGDSASGTANAQTLLGAGATSDKANSVALGYKSNADRGGSDNYTAFGLAAPQTSIGEVAVGSSGRERQITHVAAGEQMTDAVNVAQLKGALSLIAGVSQAAVTYDEDALGNPDYGRVTLGGGNAAQGTVLGNLAAGAVAAGSMQAINGGQLHGFGNSLVGFIGGGATLQADGTLSLPSYALNSIAGNGQLSLNQYSDLSATFGSISDSLANLHGLVGTATPQPGTPDPLAVRYSVDGNGQPTNEVVLTGAGDGSSVALRNLAEGSVAAGSTDAVNGSQLAASNSALASAMGGGMGYDSGSGQWSGPSFNITAIGAGGSTQQQVLDNVGDALAALDGSIVNVNQRIDNIQAGGAGNAYFAVNSDKDPAVASGQDSMAAGPQASASGQQAVALGDGATASADGSVALGAGSVADRDNTVSVGSAGQERQITHVADGSEATDAVNVRQLQASQQGTVRYDENTDGSTNYGSVTMGRPGTSTVIHNVGTGVADTDAVNVAQLNKGLGDVMDWSKNYTDQRFHDVSRDMKRIDDRASAGVASAMAMAGLPQPTEAGKRMASMAASTFHGESSMAVGVSGVSDGGRWIYKLSGSANTRGDGGVTVGAGFQW